MRAKHITMSLAMVLALALLSASLVQSQGILPYLQPSPKNQPAETESTPSDSFVPPDGYVPDAETAVKIGAIIIDRLFGEIPTTQIESITATLEGGIWIVKRKPVPGGLDGSGEVHISKKDGTILFASNMT